MRKQRQIDLVPPPAPTADTRIIRRQAKLLDQQRKILGGVSLEALTLATVQVGINKFEEGIKKMEEGLRLLQNAGLTPRASSPLAAPSPLAPVVKNPCALCGREGVYQSKNTQLPLDKRPWYCQSHAQWAMAEDAEDRRAKTVAPSIKSEAQPVAAAPTQAPATPPKLAEAMASLQGQKIG